MLGFTSFSPTYELGYPPYLAKRESPIGFAIPNRGCYHGGTKCLGESVMSTTSLKLSDDLKQRAVSAAQSQGVSTHAFMVNAIEQAATAAECRASFIADAHVARQQMQDTGKGHDADEVHAYIQARIAGKKVTKPKARSWRG